MDHDRNFKELLTNCFVEFLEVFCPELAVHLDPGSVEFLDKEVFTDVTKGERHEVDLVAKARFRGKPLGFLIHVEAQARREADFSQRMFTYFARFHEKYNLPVYPIALYSFQTPKQQQPDEYRVDFPDLAVLSFRFRVVQLNMLKWRDFENRMSPIVAALMATMRREPDENARVKLACLRMLANLHLDPARRQLISGFIDAYIQLTMEEEEELKADLEHLRPEEKENVMEIVTSWMKEGLAQGLAHERKTFVRMLNKRFGGIGPEAEEQIGALSFEQIELLAEALFDFQSLDDLNQWLELHR